MEREDKNVERGMRRGKIWEWEEEELKMKRGRAGNGKNIWERGVMGLGMAKGGRDGSCQGCDSGRVERNYGCLGGGGRRVLH